MSALPTRREHETVDVDCGRHGIFTLRLGWHPVTGAPCDLFIDQRGKSGGELNAIFQDFGIAASKLMQGRAAVAIPPKVSWWRRAGILISRRLQGKDV